MPDATYDAIIIGGGNKGLTLGMYLAKYGGMETAIFEDRHEMGGGWSSEEFVPGFVGNTHCSGVGAVALHLGPVLRDFPELAEFGAELIPFDVSWGAIFEEDHSSFCVYGKHYDPTQEKTAASFAQFSARDAETWLRVWEIFLDKLMLPMAQYVYNPPPLPGQPSPLDIALADPAVAAGLGMDPSWTARSLLEVLRDLFESDTIVAGLLRPMHSARPWPADTPGTGLEALIIPAFGTEFGCVKGGTHSLAHATYKAFLQAGGKGFAKREVDGVIIENGVAKGVRLVDGTEIGARNLVVSTVDPATLCFHLIGAEHLSPRITRRVANLSRRHATITWYSWALHDYPHYKAAEANPDIDRACWLAPTSRDLDRMHRNEGNRAAGRMPDQNNLIVWCHTREDPTQAPEGMHVMGTEDYVLPAYALDEKGWREFKKKHAEDVIRTMQAYAPNMTWENVIGYNPLTPFDACNAKNFGPEGNWTVIDPIPSQNGSFRPIPELAQYRTPIAGLYCTGAAWHFGASGTTSEGYNCYKILAQDFGLAKPWDGDAF